MEVAASRHKFLKSVPRPNDPSNTPFPSPKELDRTGLYGSLPNCRKASITRPNMRTRSPGAKPESFSASLHEHPDAQAVTTFAVDKSNSIFVLEYFVPHSF
mmetsp:Transcript_4118/g.3480  ORF Transcript_4118/g.3480 Transcript_4118/m.3480 type:complete len:101 (-) Transcript_4118:76-378(-)